ERGIEAAAVEINRIGPIAVDARAGDEIIVEVAQRRAAGAADGGASVTFDIGVNQPEQTVSVREARRPDATGIAIAEHVELARAIERAREQSPVNEIARVMDLHSGKPFEGRSGDVIVVADADDGRVGIEAGENGIADHAGCDLGTTGARRAASSR